MNTVEPAPMNVILGLVPVVMGMRILLSSFSRHRRIRGPSGLREA